VNSNPRIPAPIQIDDPVELDIPSFLRRQKLGGS